MDMGTAISSIITFPNIAWWAAIAGSDTLHFDEAGHYEKMSYHNRYYIAGANGLIRLTVPLLGGRNQRAAMKDILTDPKDGWQLHHWRTLTSAYKRSPYFDFYEHSLQTLFETPYPRLIDFNLASIHWQKLQLGDVFEEKHISEYKKDHGNITDLRNPKPLLEKTGSASFPSYYQLFSERNGFLPNLSLLDLLFCEGPQAMHWLDENREKVLATV